MAVEFFFHDQPTKECAGRGDQTRGRLDAKRTRFRSSYRAPFCLLFVVYFSGQIKFVFSHNSCRGK